MYRCISEKCDPVREYALNLLVSIWYPYTVSGYLDLLAPLVQLIRLWVASGALNLRFVSSPLAVDQIMGYKWRSKSEFVSSSCTVD